MKSSATTAEEYLAELPEERRAVLSAVRDVVRRNLPEGYEECMNFGMINYVIPLERFPNTYNKQPIGSVALAAQKQYFAVYLMGIYSDEEERRWFREAYTKSGKKLDMGKSCVLFRKLDDLPLDVIGEAVARVPPERLIAIYEATRVKKK